MNLLNAKRRPRVVVVGSLNVDYIWNLARLPVAGETAVAQGARREFGGKGANQAMASSRHGADVYLVGKIGQDADGVRYLKHLTAEGIDCALFESACAATGAAHIYLDDDGENMIVVNGGANRLLDASHVTQALKEKIDSADVLLTQLESPIQAVKAALKAATDRGVRTILNASPVDSQFKWDTPIDTVIVNEHEFASFFQVLPESILGASGEECRQLLTRHQIRNLVITRGARSTLHISADGADQIPTYHVEPVDTVGAGDTFAGTLAVCLAAGVGWTDAIRRANIAAALSTQVAGVQSAMPALATVLGVLDATPEIVP